MNKIILMIAAAGIILSCNQQKVTVTIETKKMIRATQDVSVKASGNYKVKDSIGAIYKGTEAEVTGVTGDYLQVQKSDGRVGYVWIDLGHPVEGNLPAIGSNFIVTNKVGASLCEEPKRSKSLGVMTNGEIVKIIDIAVTYYRGDYRSVPTIGREGWVYAKYFELFTITNVVTNIIK